MPHPVICSVCGKRFDRDVEQAVQTGARRYAHAACCPDNKQFVPIVEKPKKEKKEDTELQKLKDYINKLYGSSANWQLIIRQIKQYQKEFNYTYSGMLKSLVWFYEVKGNSTENSNGGVGIIPYVYQDAYNYYYSLFVAQSQNQNIDVKTIVNKVKEVIIPLPQIKEKKRMFKLLDDEEEN